MLDFNDIKLLFRTQIIKTTFQHINNLMVDKYWLNTMNNWIEHCITNDLQFKTYNNEDSYFNSYDIINMKIIWKDIIIADFNIF